jgi:hypothetical protein
LRADQTKEELGKASLVTNQHHNTLISLDY